MLKINNISRQHNVTKGPACVTKTLWNVQLKIWKHTSRDTIARVADVFNYWPDKSRKELSFITDTAGPGSGDKVNKISTWC